MTYQPQQDTTDSEGQGAFRLLTLEEAADQLRVSRWTLYRLTRQRTIRTVAIGARRLILQADLDRYVQRQHSQETV